MIFFDLLLILYFFGLILLPSKCFLLNSIKFTGEQGSFIFHRRTSDVPEYYNINLETSSKHRTRCDVNNDFRLIEFELNRTQYSLKLVCRQRAVFTFPAPVWSISSVPGQTPDYIYKILDLKDIIFNGIIFEDKEIMATVLAYYDKKQGKILYDGIFGLGTSTHVIRSIPEKYQTTPAAVQKYKKLKNTKKSDNIAFKVQNNNNKLRHTPLTNSDDYDITDNVASPMSILHVKILPVIDNKLFKLIKENLQDTLKYVKIFWNAVDLQFSKIDLLKIEITVTGVIIATDEHALSFIDKSRDAVNSLKINAFEFLENARIFFYENFINDTGLTNYDAIFIMTALNTQPSAGMSYIGRICNRLYSTALIQDDGNFLGLRSANHELGHLLNFYHDGFDNAKNCQPISKDNEITVMAPFITTAKSIIWSECSKNSLKEFIKTKASRCLKESYRVE